MVLLLRSKITYSVFLLLSFFLFNCNQNDSDKKLAKSNDTASCTPVVSLNPNGDSELSVLMRKMMKSSQNLRVLILKDSLPDKFPEEFLKIHSAKPTDSETKKASFNGFADNYLNNLNALYVSPKNELQSKYNALVSACVSCHTEHCPGPLKAINKLRLE